MSFVIFRFRQKKLLVISLEYVKLNSFYDIFEMQLLVCDSTKQMLATQQNKTKRDLNVFGIVIKTPVTPQSSCFH